MTSDLIEPPAPEDPPEGAEDAAPAARAPVDGPTAAPGAAALSAPGG